MTEFDDFEWVDQSSGRASGPADSADRSESRDHSGSRGGNSSSGSPQPQDSPQPGETSRPSQTTRSVVARPQPSNTARPRRTFWSQTGSSLRGLARRIAKLPLPVLIAVGALLFLIILTMVIDSGLYYNKIHAGVSVAGQGLSGKTADQAAVLVNKEVEKARAEPITVVNGVRTWLVTPDELGQVIDVEATVSAALEVTRKSNIVTDLARRLKLYFDGEDLPLAGTLDEETLDALLAQIAGDLDVQPVNAGFIIQDDLSMTEVEGVSGFVVDQDTLRQRLLDALFLRDATEIQVPMMLKTPDVMAADSQRAVTQVQTMLSDVVELQYIGLAPPPPAATSAADAGDSTAASAPKAEVALVKTTLTRTFSPAEMAAYIDFKAEDVRGVMTLVPFISAEKMRPFLASIERPMRVEPVDAWFTTDGANVWVKDMVLGLGLDHEATAQALTEAALRSTDRTAEAIFLDLEPDFTTQEALDMHITDELARYHTHFKSSYPGRTANVALATKLTGNKLLAPGEEYNFDRNLGPRTKANGWDIAPGLVNGRLVEDIFGGGICQVSTTLFNAAFEAGLKITERWNHSVFIDHYPAGRDATVTGGGEPKNLRFVNDTPGYIWIYSESDGTDTTFIIFGTDDGRAVQSFVLGPYDVTQRPVDYTATTLSAKLPENSTTIIQSGQDDMKYKVTREVTWPNGSTTTDVFLSEWKMKRAYIAFPTSTTVTTTTLPVSTATTGGT